ncbi:potassium channel family protein [Methylocapsa acidiphila]|uniref:potassium channel family protein n=1 Tax=Methylocapsa acidiphila TaxID=133552 RepID=UPI001FD889D9|nr:potassium channel family protein [Methylocapsa acidiphila]
MKRPRFGRASRFHGMNRDVKQRLVRVTDRLHDPMLSVLTVLLAILIFGIVPLRAAGIFMAQGYGFAMTLLLASCVLILSKRLLAIFFMMVAVALAAAAVVIRVKLDSTLDLYVEAGASLTINVLLIVVVARAVFAPGVVTYHRVIGAVLLYLTIGLTFVSLFTFVGLLAPNAFSGMPLGYGAPFTSSVIYFSFVTLTSTGYGDITPIHPLARALCNLEGIIGQLFPATLLARLVTLELQSRRG